jgi:hypothetical protein
MGPIPENIPSLRFLLIGPADSLKQAEMPEKKK